MTALRQPWRGWQRSRERALIGAGMSPALAKNFSTREARGRARAAEAAGTEAALAGTLLGEDQPDGTVRFFLALPPDLIPADRREAVCSFFQEGRPPGARN